MTNKLLSRQIKRVFGSNPELSDELVRLLEMVNHSYEHYERDRRLIERAMEISSEELRASYKNLADQNEELELFVSKVSHDLKAPIRTINSFAQLINRELSRSKPDDKIVDYLSFITNGAKNMQLLIEDLLFHARLDLKLELKDEIDLNKLIQTVKNNLAGLIQDNNASIIVESLPVVSGRSYEMLQLFQNLIGNAIKFKRAEIDPMVEVCCNEKDSEFVISVEDNGIGIESENKEKVFGAFQRLNGSSDFEGSGLGLSICKKIIDNIGGRIWVESEYGVGTKFIFSIPKPKESNTESNIRNSKVNVNNQTSIESSFILK